MQLSPVRQRFNTNLPLPASQRYSHYTAHALVQPHLFFVSIAPPPAREEAEALPLNNRRNYYHPHKILVVSRTLRHR